VRLREVDRSIFFSLRDFSVAPVVGQIEDKRMQLFSKLYNRILHWSTHRHAIFYLSGLSFAEASFFPLPPDLMLAPMSLSRPQLAWRYAAITAIASTLGGVFGYLIGVFGFDLIYPWIVKVGYEQSYLTARAWFDHWGFWAMFIAAFTPIPYKLFTVAAGALRMAILPFIVASLIGRSARFFMVAALMRWGGQRMDQVVRRYIDIAGWSVVIIGLVLYFSFR
jgi:membrane protein YqaA with SNARE-associated domain